MRQMISADKYLESLSNFIASSAIEQCIIFLVDVRLEALFLDMTPNYMLSFWQLALNY